MKLTGSVNGERKGREEVAGSTPDVWQIKQLFLSAEAAAVTHSRIILMWGNRGDVEVFQD